MILVNPEKLSMPQQVQKNAEDIKQHTQEITDLKTGYNKITGTYIENGILHIVLQDGTDLTAGEIKNVDSMAINGSQHLVVTYSTGETQDLGAIFTGNITIDGTITATNGFNVNGGVTATTLSQSQPNETNAFNFSGSYFTFNNIYSRYMVVNQMLIVISNIKAVCNQSRTLKTIGGVNFMTSNEVGEKIYNVDGVNIDPDNDNKIVTKIVGVAYDETDSTTVIPIVATIVKRRNSYRDFSISIDTVESYGFENGHTYVIMFRGELSLL